MHSVRTGTIAGSFRCTDLLGDLVGTSDDPNNVAEVKIGYMGQYGWVGSWSGASIDLYDVKVLRMPGYGAGQHVRIRHDILDPGGATELVYVYGTMGGRFAPNPNAATS